MSATAIPKLKLKKQYVVSEPQSTEELREHLKRHVEQEYELVQVLPNGKAFVVIFSKEVPITAM